MASESLEQRISRLKARHDLYIAEGRGDGSGERAEVRKRCAKAGIDPPPWARVLREPKAKTQKPELPRNESYTVGFEAASLAEMKARLKARDEARGF